MSNGYVFSYDTVIGPIRIAENGRGEIDWIGFPLSKVPEKEVEETEAIGRMANQLDEYLSGKRRAFDVKLDLKGTEFQMKVWNALSEVPYGELVSYSDIAKRIGNENASRAVGSACKANPLPPIVPCHRIVRSSGIIGEYLGGKSVKEHLIDLEKRK